MRRVKGIDLDEVVFNFIDPFIVFANKKYGTSYTRQDMRSYSFERSGIIPKGTNEENVLEFCRQGGVLNMPLMPGAKEALRLLNSLYTIVYVTTRQQEFEDDTNQCLIEAGLWNPVYFATKEKPKSAWVKELHIHTLVDDNPFNIQDVRDNTEARTILLTNIEEAMTLCKPHYHARTWADVYLHMASRYSFAK
jgi:uncharacterized HAD superfamily protein